jgi:nucleolar protein 56
VQEDPILFETGAGLIILVEGQVVQSYRMEEEGSREEAYSKVAEWARIGGYGGIKTNAASPCDYFKSVGIRCVQMDRTELEKIQSAQKELLVKANLAPSEQDAIQIIRREALKTAEQVVREESSRPDLQLVQAIQALDEIDKFLNNTLSRVSEWYGLHFPELRDLVQDELQVCKIILDNGKRENLSKEDLEQRGLSPKKAEAIVLAAEGSKGGSLSDTDLERIRKIAKIALDLSSERERLAGYVESAMTIIAPNVRAVAGATIGARLIAKAGGLDRLARLPASTIQILGAEKALFRALKTGSRPPKHGILFQHQEVHTAPKWQRGKIARTIANKVAIAARIDYYRGTEESSLTGLLEERLKQIKIRYKEAPPVKPFRSPRREKKKKARR